MALPSQRTPVRNTASFISRTVPMPLQVLAAVLNTVIVFPQ
jgi:hypothetical protein